MRKRPNTEKYRQIEAYIIVYCRGKRNAKKAAEIAAATGKTVEAVRRAAVRGGFLSAANGKGRKGGGYYYPDTFEEVERAADFLDGYAAELKARAEHLRKRYKNLKKTK